MKTTEKSKTFLNISIAVSITICSLSLLIYTLNNNPAKADPINPTPVNGYKLAGVVSSASTAGFYVRVIGYNETTGEVKVLAKGDKIK